MTTDSGMLKLPRELAVLMQTRLALVVAEASGHDPLKATGLVFAHLPWICDRVDHRRAQIWCLTANRRPAEDPWDRLARLAEHRTVEVDELYQGAKLTHADLGRNPLA